MFQLVLGIKLKLQQDEHTAMCTSSALLERLDSTMRGLPTPQLHQVLGK